MNFTYNMQISCHGICINEIIIHRNDLFDSESLGDIFFDEMMNTQDEGKLRTKIKTIYKQKDLRD